MLVMACGELFTRNKKIDKAKKSDETTTFYYHPLLITNEHKQYLLTVCDELSKIIKSTLAIYSDVFKDKNESRIDDAMLDAVPKIEKPIKELFTKVIKQVETNYKLDLSMIDMVSKPEDVRSKVKQLLKQAKQTTTDKKATSDFQACAATIRENMTKLGDNTRIWLTGMAKFAKSNPTFFDEANTTDLAALIRSTSDRETRWLSIITNVIMALIDETGYSETR